jgi:hypothetical protein
MLRKKGCFRTGSPLKHPSGVKALFIPLALSARLKSCPDTKLAETEFSRNLPDGGWMKVPQSLPQGCILAVAALIFLVSGGQKAIHGSIDFVPVYTGASCMIHGCDPYKTDQLEKQYLDHGGRVKEQAPWITTEVVTYPPSTLLALSPLALFSFPAARIIWLVQNGALFITAVVLALRLCPDKHRWLATVLAAALLAASGQMLALGQTTPFAVALLAIGTYLFLRGRYLTPATVLLALTLAVKPQIGGFVVLFLLLRGVRRGHAGAAMAAALVLMVAGGSILKSRPASADWVAELRSNVINAQTGGEANDPGPDYPRSIGSLQLQSITSVFLADPQWYDAAAYVISAIFLAIVAVGVARSRPGLENHLLAVGTLAVVTLFPVYHRFYDSRLLILALPAALLVFRERRVLGATLCALTVLATFSIQYRTQDYLLKHGMWQAVRDNKLLFVLLLREQTLLLLLVACLLILALFTIRFAETQSEQVRA